MSDYTRLYDFSVKDSLPSGNAAKIIKGTEVDGEFDAIVTSIATKADTTDVDGKAAVVSSPVAGDLFIQSAGGDLEKYANSPAELVTKGQRKNILINGNMRVSQRGGTFAAVADGTYSIDRWKYNKSGSMVHTITYETTGGPNDTFINSIKLDVTTASGGISASDYCELSYNMEGTDYRAIRGKEITVSFWVKDTKTGQHYVSINSGGGDSSYITGYTVSSADTWEYKSVTLTMAETFGTWGTGSTKGLQLNFVLAAGSNFHGTADTWLNSLDIAASDVVDSTDSTSNDFLLTGVQLEIGADASVYEPLPFVQEISLCQRYYEKSYAVDTDLGTATAIGSSRVYITGLTSATNSAGLTSEFKVSKRAVPTMTFYSTDSGDSGKIYDNQSAADLTPTVTAGESSVFWFATQGSSQTTINLSGHWTADAEL